MRERRIRALLLTVLLILPIGTSCRKESTTGPGKALEATDLLPKDDDIQGWKGSGEARTASNYDELYAHIDGAGVLYIDHGFEFYAGQLYNDPKGVELEVAIYDQGSAEDARALYEDPLMVPSLSNDLPSLGEEGRVDEGGLFHYGVEFIRDRFFVRVTIQDKSDDGLNTAMLFALQIDQDIQ